jgi:site-specific recombinase XerD
MKNQLCFAPAVPLVPPVETIDPQIESFAESLAAQGYSKVTINQKISILRRLDEWLVRRQIGIHGFDETNIDRFLRSRRNRGYVRPSDPSTLRSLLRHLRETKVISSQPTKRDDSPLQRLQAVFARYLAEERGLSQATLDQYLLQTRRFLSGCFGNAPITLGELRPHHVSQFILCRARSVGCSAAQHAVTALRTLLRFLQQRGYINTNLAAAVPSVAKWSLAGLPKYLTSCEVESVLETCKNNSVEEQRDRAILLLLARLCLRAGEVAQLTLDDIDWDNGELTIRGKGGCFDRLPIPVDVGKALVTYLRHSRPRCSSRKVFIRLRAPSRGLAGCDAIDRVVRTALRRAGLNPAFKGAHVLRHSLATRMVRGGASLPEIGQILRHQLPRTTAIYAKVDLAALRALAQPWPGR